MTFRNSLASVNARAASPGGHGPGARADLRTDADTGLLVLDIRPNQFRVLKNRQSERTLPVPTRLAPELLAHVADKPPDARLFPSLRVAAKLSARFKAVVREMFGDDPALVWHSLRHSMEDHLRERVPDAVRYYVRGSRSHTPAHAITVAVPGFGSWRSGWRNCK